MLHYAVRSRSTYWLERAGHIESFSDEWHDNGTIILIQQNQHKDPVVQWNKVEIESVH